MQCCIPNKEVFGRQIKLVPSSQGALPEKGRFEPRARPGSAVEAVVRSAWEGDQER